MAVHDWAVNLAKKLIDKHGREVTLVKSSSSEAQSGKRWRGSDEPFSGAEGTTATATAVFIDEVETDSEATLVKRGEKSALVAHADLTPIVDISQYDALRDGDNTWRIIEIVPLKPGNQDIMYTARLAQ